MNRLSCLIRGAVLIAGATTLANAAPTIGPTTVTPPSIPVTVSTAVTITAAIADPSLIPGGVNLQRLNANGTGFVNLGVMHDDGLNGDAVAGDGILSLRLNFLEPTPFPVQLRVSAAFRGSLTRVNSALFALNVIGAAAPTITITNPPNLAFLNTNPVTVTGTVSDPTATVTVNGIAAPPGGGSFSVAVPLIEGNNTLTAVAGNSQGSMSTASVQVTLDTTPPRITIDSPSDGFSTADASITVTGIANDVVVGTVNNQQVQVTVNGLPAQVSNRSFQAVNVPLSVGDNVISAVARDRAGNGATTRITVRRTSGTQARVVLVSGNNQSGQIGSPLPSALVAGIVDDAGNPVSGQALVFTVTQNNGTLDGGLSTRAVTTDGQGHAQVNLNLGTRSGAGNNIVTATAFGFAGSAIFAESGTSAPSAQINADAGSNQTGAVSQPLPHPFVAVVTDSGHNRLPNIPVTFNVTQGAGNFNGQPSITTTTDPDGRALAVLTLGSQEGTENNVVEANFSGNAGFPAAFTASGRVPGNASATRITGVVLDNTNNPVPGVTLRAFQNVSTQSSTGLQALATVQADLQGQFTMQPAPVGSVRLIADGSTAQRPGTWPNLEYDLVTVAGQNNTIGMPIYLLPLSQNQLCVTATTGGTLTLPQVPGFSLTVLPGSATFPGGSKTGCVSVTTVHPDKVPMVPGFGQQPRFIVTIQPAGTLFSPPAPIAIPNLDGLKPREVTEMYSFDHDLGTFVSIGTGTVSDDATMISSDAGVGVLKAGWFCGGPPTPTGTAGVCPDCQKCNGTNCVADPAKEGQACSIGICVSGVCQPKEYDPGDPMHDQVSIPLTKVNIGVSAGELVLFNIVGEDKDRVRRRGTVNWTNFDGTGPYKITLSITGPASWNSLKSGTKTLSFNSLITGNANLYTDNDWQDGVTITVTAKFEDLAPATVPAPDVGSVKDPDFNITWTIVKRGQCPTSMMTVGGTINMFVPTSPAHPAVFTYKMGPALPAPKTAPYYQNQTILESFGAITAYNFKLNDLTQAFRDAHPELTTADQVAQFLWNAGNNGTFVIDGNDLIADQHYEGEQPQGFTAAASARGFGFVLPQTYSCGGNTVQNYTITAQFMNGATTVKKSGP